MTTRHCSICGQPLRPGARADARYCSTRCRVTAHRNLNLVRTDEPAPAAQVTVRSFGWYVDGIIPATHRAEIEQLYERVCERYGYTDLDSETVEFSNPRGYALHLELYAPLATLDAAETFAGAVTAIIE